MATAGSIVVDLLARTGSFETDMDRAARKLKGVGQEVDTVSRNINRLMVASGAALAAFAGTSAALAMQMAKGMDATAKMAEQIGTTTEALTGLRFAAQQYANVSDQTFDMAMRRMTRRIEEAANGAGGAKNALEALGLSAQQLSRLSPDKQFLALADALKNTDSQAARLRHTMAIFDTEGMPLVAALQRGSAEMERGIETARRYGLVLSQDAAQAAQQFVSNMDALSFASRGFQQALSEAVLPYLVEATNKLVEFSEKAGPAAEHVEQAFKIAGVGAGALALVLGGRLVASATAVSASFVRATYDTVRYEYALARMADQTRIASAGFATLAATSRGWSIISGILGGPGGVVATIGLAAAGFVAMAAASRDAGEGLISVADSAEEAIKKFRELGVLQRQEELTKLGNTHAEQARAASKAWADFIDQLEPTTARGARAVAQMRAEMREEVEAIKRNTSMSSRDMQQAISDLIDTWVENGRITAEQATAYRAAAAGAEKLQATANQTEQRMSTLSEEAARLEAALRGAAGGAQTLNEGLSQTNEAGAKFLERLADQAITAGLKTQREQLEALVAAGKLVYTPEDLEKARKHADHIDRMNAAYKGASSAAKEFESSVKSLIAAHLPEVKATEDLHKSLATLQAAQRAGIVVGQNYTKALESINLAYAKQVNDLLPESIKKAQDQVKAAREQQKQLEQQLRTFGMAESAVLALAAADTDSAIAKLEAAKANEIANGATTERIKHIEAEIQALRELRDLQLGSAGLQGQLEWREQQRQQWEDWARDVEQIFQQVGQSLTDALFEGGKSARDLIKDLFKSLVLRVLVQPVMGQLQGWVTQQLGGLFGVQNPQQGGGFSMPSGLGGIGNAFSWAGNAMGSASLGQFGAGMTVGAGGAFTDAGAQAFMDIGVGGSSGFDAGNWIGENGANILSAASVIYDVSQGNYGRAAGTVIGSFLPIPGGQVIGNVIGGLIDDIFGDDKPDTRHAQMSHTELLGDGKVHVSTWDDRQSVESQKAAAQIAEQSINAALDLFDKIGIDAEFKRFTTLMESSILGDKQGVGSSATLRIGDLEHEIGLAIESSWTKHGFGGWSEAEMLPRLQTDIQLTLLEAFQVAGDALPKVLFEMLDGVDIRGLTAEQAQALAQQFSAVVEQVSSLQEALGQLPFATLRDLSFDAAANLIQFAGGLEQLNAGMTAYFENFYTQEEQLAFASEQIGKTFADLGLTMPDVTQGAAQAKAEFRAIVESLDPMTEEGQRAIATMMNMAGGFAQLVAGMDDLAAAAERAAEEQRRAAEQARQAVWDAAVAAGESAFSALSRSVAAEKTRLQRESEAIATALRNSISAASTTVSELTGLTNRLTSTVQRMVGQLDEGRNREWAQERIDRALSVAKLTGVMPSGADFEQALQIVSQPSEGLYSSFEDYQADFLKTAHTVSELNELAEGQLSTEKRALKALEDQLTNSQQWYQAEMERLDLMLEQERQALDIAMGTYEAVLTIPEALAGIRDAIANIQLVTPPAAGGGGGSGGGSGGAGSGYAPHVDYLTGNPDLMAAYLAAGGGNYMPPEQWAQQHWDTYGKYEDRDVKLRGFAAGTNYVPYDMTANIHQGEIIIDPRSSDILRRYGIVVQGGGNDAALRLVQQELREMRQMQQTLLEEIGRNTNDTARTNRQMMQEPQPVFVTNVVPTTEAVPGQ